MSRGGWSDSREENQRHESDKPGAADVQDTRTLEPFQNADDRIPDDRARDVRQSVRGRHDHEYRIRDSEWEILDTVGRFRVVAEHDLTRPEPNVTRNDLRHLAESRLIERRTAIVNHHPERLVVLTRVGKDLIERHNATQAKPNVQRYYARFVKPRELAHDAQIYRAYLAERSRIEADGGRIARVMLDYELKRDYQAYLNRRDRPSDAAPADDRQAYAAAHGLPIIDGHLEIPDLRLEVTRPDGSVETRDLEVVTEHYSRSQLAGKTRAGFTLYRPANSSRGGTPHDPRTLVWLR